MHAVFFMSDRLDLAGVEDQSIHIFDSAKEADDWLFSKLVESGEITIGESGLPYVNGDACESRAEALEELRYRANPVEFFHTYKAVDHRETKQAASS